MAARGPGGPAPAGGGTFVDRMSLQGQQARGLYITYPYMQIYKSQGVARALKRARADTAVIDLKDDQGRISYRTRVQALLPQVVDKPLDFPTVLKELKEQGIYTVARIVCFNDPHLPKRELDRAILDTRRKRRGQPWVSWGTGDTWLDPYNKANHDLFLQMAVEAASFGFDEVQLDYIRFPVDKGTQFAHYPHEVETLRRFVLLDLLRRIDAAIDIPLGVDVFGLTALREGDPTGLGQSLADWTAHVEVFSPMLYVNAMPGWRMDVPDRGRVLVRAPTGILRKRVGPGPVIRPFMQAFDNGLGDNYTPEFIVDQILGARAGGADGYLFWNPGSNYGMVSRGAARLGPKVLPFPTNGRDTFRAELWDKGQHELSPR